MTLEQAETDIKILMEQINTRNRLWPYAVSPSDIAAVDDIKSRWDGITNKDAGFSFACAARKQGTAGGNDPADCNWPFCGCDPYASKVIESLQECGVLRMELSGAPNPMAGEKAESMRDRSQPSAEAFPNRRWATERLQQQELAQSAPPKPSIGRIVHYRLTDASVDEISRLRSNGFHIGARAISGDALPMIIVSIWQRSSPDDICICGQVFLDGNHVLWVQSVVEGTTPGTWSWPPKV